MKRITPYLILVVPAVLLLLGCDQSNPAGDVSGPLLKPDKCEPWPECRDGGGGEGDYTLSLEFAEEPSTGGTIEYGQTVEEMLAEGMRHGGFFQGDEGGG